MVTHSAALELTPQTWRWYKSRAAGGPLSQLAIHQFDMLHSLGGEIVEVSSMRRNPSWTRAATEDVLKACNHSARSSSVIHGRH
jgi:predicted dehydrogenase